MPPQGWVRSMARMTVATTEASRARRFASSRLPSYDSMKLPCAQARPGSAAVMNLAKSAIRGRRSSFTWLIRRSPIEMASSSAPSIRGRTASKAAQNSSSVCRSVSRIGGKFSINERSRRSACVASSSMPLRMTGRRAWKSASSSTVHNCRFEKPLPVAKRQIASLSNAMMCPL